MSEDLQKYKLRKASSETLRLDRIWESNRDGASDCCLSCSHITNALEDDAPKKLKKNKNLRATLKKCFLTPPLKKIAIKPTYISILKRLLHFVKYSHTFIKYVYKKKFEFSVYTDLNFLPIKRKKKDYKHKNCGARFENLFPQPLR